MTAALIAGVMVVAAISVSEGRLQPDRLKTVLIMAAVAAVTNTSMGLIAGSLLLHSPQATFLLVVPIATVFLSYGAYLREREKHESLEFLYASTRILSETPGWSRPCSRWSRRPGRCSAPRPRRCCS